MSLALAKNGEHAIAEGKLLEAITEMKKLDNAGTVHRVRPRLLGTRFSCLYRIRSKQKSRFWYLTVLGNNQCVQTQKSQGDFDSGVPFPRVVVPILSWSLPSFRDVESLYSQFVFLV